MQQPRLLFFSLKNRFVESSSLLKSFGTSKRFHSSSYVRSARRPYIPSFPDEKSKSSWHISFLTPAVILGGIGGFAFLLHYNDERRAIPKGSESWEGCTIKGPKIGGPFVLIDTKFKLVTERDFAGNWVLLYFGYTSSPDVGPAEVQKMAMVIDALESKQNVKVLPVFVTIDPLRDTSSQLHAYLKEFDSRIIGLTGSVAAIRQMAQEYRVYFKKVDEEENDYLVESSHNMYLINPDMEVIRCFSVEYNAEELIAEILKVVKKTRA